MPKYIEYSNGYNRENRRATFIPAETINCEPPYIAGRIDSCNVRRRLNGWPKPTDKDACEQLVGIKLQLLTN